MINTIINNYRILSVIGKGGMGTVYLAEHTSLKRKAAIKALNPELTAIPEIKNRFFNEAVTLSKLNHNNIVTLYDFSEHGGNLYLIMEYVSGKSLDEMIKQNYLPVNRGIKIFNEILNGFSYAHREGIVHRDIKPGNIIITGNDTPKILDFGIAKIMDSDITMTKTGTRMGSVLYMSPEQILGKNIDYRSDIYSLGVTLFEILSGMLPYSNALSEFEIQTKIVQEPLPYIRNLKPDIPENIQNAIITATAKNPDARFACCEDFKAALSAGGYTVQYEPVNSGNINLQKTAYAPGQDIYKTQNSNNPYDRTSVSGSNQQYVYPQSQNNNNRNLILGISGGALVLIIAVILIFMLAGKNDESDLKPIKKENVQTQESNTRQNEQQPPPSQQNNNYGYSGRYPETSMRNLTYNELLGYSKSELRIMRNEIYARHGRIFQSPDLINYFSSQSWYTPLYTDKEVQYMLTQIEKNNITTIQQAEKTAR